MQSLESHESNMGVSNIGKFISLIPEYKITCDKKFEDD